ncbi:hypothetical protein DL96DRAFT_1710899 [Flagelloscypha sp. PMI_526]|nr:hypothetical protein DL96DRAFT_1710899 [Flagelloscypha sp. PMI_526]
MNRNVKKRSCDACRRKKIRCDGPEMEDKVCSSCKSYDIECKYEESAKKRGPPKGYVESLEARLAKAEELLHQDGHKLAPDGDFTRELGVSVDPVTWAVHRTELEPSTMVSSGKAQSPSSTASEPTPRELFANIIRRTGTDINEPIDDEHFIGPPITQLSDNLGKFHLDPGAYRFFGKSSGAMLVQTALNMKTEYTGQSAVKVTDCVGPMQKLRPEFWTVNEVNPVSLLYPANFYDTHYYRQWEREPDAIDKPKPTYIFPDPDLTLSLINLYFEHINNFWPLLHRPTFERLWTMGFHNTDPSFAGTVLLVIAAGSRYSEDPRVFYENDRGHSAGWKYFNQVAVVRRSMLTPPGLYDLQFYALFSIRTLSSSLGRPTAIQEEDFDIEFLVECDDEWWDHPDKSKAWKQPPGQPAEISAFNMFLRLNRVLAQVHRTVYSSKKHKFAMHMIGEDWEQLLVTELDSLLNHWVDDIPPHLQWDPHQRNELFLQQSGWLHTAYYNLQILVHRPFLSSSKAPKHLMWSSFAICTNAARSSARILDALNKRRMTPPPVLQIYAFTSAIVLLLAIWGGKKAGLTTNPKTEMINVAMCMDYLKTQEARWHSAGKLWDIIHELANVGDIPLPPLDEFIRRNLLLHLRRGDTGSAASTPPSMEAHPLPMYTAELGQLPATPMDFFQRGNMSTFQPQQPTPHPTSIGIGGPHPPSTVPQPMDFQASSQFIDPTGVATMGGGPTAFAQMGMDPNETQFTSAHPFLDNTMNLWATLPVEYDRLDDWGQYLTNFQGDMAAV